jgi:hypothetical protein
VFRIRELSVFENFLFRLVIDLPAPSKDAAYIFSVTDNDDCSANFK